MEQKQYDELVAKIGKEAADQINAKMKDAQIEIDKHLAEAKKGMITEDQLKAKQEESLKDVKETIEKLEKAAKTQGEVINQMKENSGPAKGKTLEDVLKENVDAIKAVLKAGTGNVEINLKTAGVTSIGNTIQPQTPPPNSPYLPAAGPVNASNFFGIIYNPNFITNYVNSGRTNFSMLPWVNETTVEGAAAAVQEGALKPLWNTRFKVEMSQAKKIAAMTTITEEFDQDLPGFTTIIERLLQEEVSRKWDDAIYAGVIAAAFGYTITGLNGKIDDANYWDALRSGIAQIGKNNFNANFIGVNPVTNALIEMQKSKLERDYLMPPFLQRINAILREANKVTEGQVLVGDIKQYNVDLYKDLVLKVGFNNDDFQRNQFSVVAEIRYHDYISDNRKRALAYYNLASVTAQIASGS
jgi:HK97 family phage major capsid protein